MSASGEHVLATLADRGFIYQSSDDDALHEMLRRPVTYYTGFDPTGPSLTAGHLVPIMMMAHLQRAGHRPIVLCGGGTALVGDPSGKTSSRPILTRAEIDANLAGQRAQLLRFIELDEGKGLVVNNADWLASLNYIEFLRDIGRHFSVNAMLSAEIYRTRLEQNLPLSFLEFNYQLLQAYDFLHLYRAYGCTLQCAGSDQWANCLAGMDLIRRLEGAQAQVLCAPLLTTATGAKMGKTEAGAVWLSAERTSPYDFYQYWVNVDDRDVASWLKLFTFLPLDQIGELTSVEGAALNAAKRTLAREVTTLVHGAQAAHEAEDAARALFGGAGGARDAMPSTEVAGADLDTLCATVLDAFSHTGLCKSRSEARRLVDQGGAYVNGEQARSIEDPVGSAALRDGEIVLRAGKKRYHRLVAVGAGVTSAGAR